MPEVVEFYRLSGSIDYLLKVLVPSMDEYNTFYTKHVPLSQLEPGDLLFYSYKGTVNTIHHISIYAGNGMMWEANSKDKGLLFSNIYSVKGLMPYGGRV